MSLSPSPSSSQSPSSSTSASPSASASDNDGGRLWSSGIELGSLTDGVEFNFPFSNYNLGDGALSTTTVRSGTYSFKADAGGGNHCGICHNLSSSRRVVFVRFCIYVESMPDGEDTIALITDDANTVWNEIAWITLDQNGRVKLISAQTSQVIGFARISTNRWYTIEYAINGTTAAATTIEGRITDDNNVMTSLGSATVNLSALGSYWLDQVWFILNAQGGLSAGVVYYDDLAINTNIGTFQNSWPGVGSIIHLHPNAAGDNNELGSALSTNYQQVDEITPDDVNTKITSVSDAANEKDDYNLEDTPDAIDDNAIIKLVHVGVRYAGGGAGTNDSFGLRIKASANGTLQESLTAITPNSTSYKTNANSSPINYPLTLYNLPGQSEVPYTKPDLDMTQIGWKKTADSTNGALISTLWLLVEYVPTEVVSYDRWILNDISLPRPSRMYREFIYVKKDLVSINGRTTRDFSARKEEFVLEYDYLNQAQINRIMALVELNVAMNFRVTENNLTITSTPVFPFIRRREYPTPGGSFLEKIQLILIEVS